MAQYRVTEPSYLNGRYVAAGELVDYAGIPGFNLEPVDDAAKQAKDAAGVAASRNVNGRAFQQDLTRSDGTPSAAGKADPKLDLKPAGANTEARQGKPATAKAK